ncbi:hypothetical protein Q8F55_006709 [Vanrija albida]|uniref:Uncharacterized protein n=1 Tax=Vanrija albida TaxID=181172 RepID=A0ABR3PXV8_9TREE
MSRRRSIWNSWSVSTWSLPSPSPTTPYFATPAAATHYYTMDDDPWADTPATPPRKSVSKDEGEGSGLSAPPVAAASAPAKATEEGLEEHEEEEVEVEEETRPPAVDDGPAHEADETPAPEPEPPSEPAPTPAADDADADAFPDDDAGFAAEPDPYASTALAPPPAARGFDDDGFDDFDDFSASAAGPSTAAFDAGFGDDDGFGDFGDVQEFEGGFVEPQAAPAPAVESWSALSLRPVPPRRELLQRISAVLGPLAPDADAFTDEPMRDVDELHQVLVAESSRVSYAKLTTAPILKPLDWTRSRVRRDHLIAMGVPVNLDEVDSHRLAALPPLHISTKGMGEMPRRSSSREPASAGGNSGKAKARDSYGGSAPASAAPHTNGDAERSKYGLGERPIVDVPRAEELCGLDEDALSIMPLARLRALEAELERHTADGSTLLAWFLQLKDAQKQDADT